MGTWQCTKFSMKKKWIRHRSRKFGFFKHPSENGKTSADETMRVLQIMGNVKTGGKGQNDVIVTVYRWKGIMSL
jgi:hypothetical protein